MTEVAGKPTLMTLEQPNKPPTGKDTVEDSGASYETPV